MWGKFKTIVRSHKFISLCVLAALVFGGRYAYQRMTATEAPARYVLASAARETLIVTVSGSGQVSSSNQVDLKPKASGDITTLAVANGQEVKAGALIAQLDARDAQKSVRDAEASLESAKIALEKLTQPADTLSVIQSQNALAQAQESKDDAHASLVKARDDGFNAIANAFLDIPSIMQGLDDILHGDTAGLKGQDNIQAYADLVKEHDERTLSYASGVEADYQNARVAYNKAFDDYKRSTRSADLSAIEILLDETYTTVRAIAESVKSTVNFLNFVQDIMLPKKLKVPALTAAYLANLDSYTGQVNGHLTSLLSLQTTIKNARDTIVNADRSIAEKTESLKKLQDGPDALDVQSAKLTVTQRENALTDAKEKLADYVVRAPFDGRIAAVNVTSGDTVSAGTAIATLLAHQQIAEIALNEVDAAKVNVGQKVTLTFDAVEGLGISGEVAEIDAIGTVSQGVVSYTVTISFDTQDDRVRPGMSVTAVIITDAKPDVLAVPNSAVKTQGAMNYVEVLAGTFTDADAAQGVIAPTAPRPQAVEIGISNDTLTEIVSGVGEGDWVVVRTITAASQTAPTTQTGGNALFGGRGGIGGATGGAVRIQGR